MSESDPSQSGTPGDVLSSLPSARPQRRSPKRDGGARAKSPGRAAKRAPGSRPKRARAASTGRSKPASGTASKPIAAQGYQAVDSSPVEPPTSTEILVSAVQAAGEVAQIGLTLGERLLRAAASRLPKP